MTSDQGKKGFVVCTILSLVIGLALSFYQYGVSLDARSINMIGLSFITTLGLYTLFIAIRAGSRQSE